MTTRSKRRIEEAKIENRENEIEQMTSKKLKEEIQLLGIPLPLIEREKAFYRRILSVKNRFPDAKFKARGNDVISEIKLKRQQDRANAFKRSVFNQQRNALKTKSQSTPPATPDQPTAPVPPAAPPVRTPSPPLPAPSSPTGHKRRMGDMPEKEQEEFAQQEDELRRIVEDEKLPLTRSQKEKERIAKTRKATRSFVSRRPNRPPSQNVTPATAAPPTSTTTTTASPPAAPSPRPEKEEQRIANARNQKDPSTKEEDAASLKQMHADLKAFVKKLPKDQDYDAGRDLPELRKRVREIFRKFAKSEHTKKLIPENDKRFRLIRTLNGHLQSLPEKIRRATFKKIVREIESDIKHWEQEHFAFRRFLPTSNLKEAKGPDDE
jgi:ribosomal protein S15P/S13E